MLRDMLVIFGSFALITMGVLYAIYAPYWWLGWGVITITINMYVAAMFLRSWRHFCVFEKELELKTEFEKMLRR